MTPDRPLTIGLVAGESSGDNLGAGLIAAIRAAAPGTRFFGVAGPRMKAAGCESLADSEELAVMGLFEVLHHLPRLLGLRRRVRAAMLDARPDVFVGIDAPEFNLGLAPALHEAGLRTVQYVSPQVWAWRRGRAARMARYLDLVLCLLPFERGVYDDVGLRSIFVGHPLADQLPLVPDRAAARRALGRQIARAAERQARGTRRARLRRARQPAPAARPGAEGPGRGRARGGREKGRLTWNREPPCSIPSRWRWRA